MQGQSEIVTIEHCHARKLNNERRIFVYLPPSYGWDREKRYPVLYMHAGQRAFAPAAPGTESWNIHLAADRLIAEGAMDEIIIVAIAHVRPAAANEYYHYAAPAEEAEAGMRCSGIDYEDFIVHDLKPHIDERFRTLPDPPNTGLIGSSAGALSTYHIGFRNPDVFGKLIMLSPYFVKAQLDERSETKLREEVLYRPFDGAHKPPVKVWLDIGDAEGLFLPRHIRDAACGLMDCGYQYGKELAYLEQPDAAHQEADWGQRVHIPLLYMFGRQGQAASLELLGRDVVGLKGMRTHINALLRYDSGFAMSVLDGTYRVESPDVLEVLPDGTIVPKQTGTTVVTLSAGGLEMSKSFTVVEELSEFVTVTMTAEVPDEPEPAAYIFGGMGMKLLYADENRYAGTFLVPRDSGYRFRFTRGFRKFETDAQGNSLPNRSFRACEDIALHYQIGRWDGAPAHAQVRRNYADPTF